MSKIDELTKVLMDVAYPLVKYYYSLRKNNSAQNIKNSCRIFKPRTFRYLIELEKPNKECDCISKSALQKTILYAKQNKIKQCEVMKMKNRKVAGLRVGQEHMTPVSCISDLSFNVIYKGIKSGSTSTKIELDLIKMLNNYYKVCLITPNDDKKLNNAGLRASLGNAYTPNGRYKQANVVFYDIDKTKTWSPQNKNGVIII